jgi:hypothetical protein
VPKKRKPGKVREIVPESQRYSYKLHGVWVRHKKLQHEGRVAYYDRKLKLVAVVWEPATKRESPKYPQKTSSASLIPKELLTRLRQYEPLPWYDFEEINRRKKRLDG